MTFPGTWGMSFKENGAIFKAALLTLISTILVGEEVCVGAGHP